MSLSTTTTTAAISASKIYNIPVTSVTTFVVGNPIMINGEIMYIAGVNSVANTFTARMRGAEGTAAMAHDVLSPVVTGLPSDFPGPAPGAISAQPPTDDLVVTIGQDQTIILPNQNVMYNIAKASACAITLSAPPATGIGVTVLFVSASPYAHVLTYAPGFLGGVNTVATFRALVGATLALQIGAGGQVSILAPGTSNVTLSA